MTDFRTFRFGEYLVPVIRLIMKSCIICQSRPECECGPRIVTPSPKVQEILVEGDGVI